MSKYCPACGVELIDDAKFCKNCGSSVSAVPRGPTIERPAGEKSHTAAIVIGYILAVLIPLIGLIIGIYLATRKDSQSASKHGKYIIIVAVIIWFIGFMSSAMLYR